MKPSSIMVQVEASGTAGPGSLFGPAVDSAKPVVRAVSQVPVQTAMCAATGLTVSNTADADAHVPPSLVRLSEIGPEAVPTAACWFTATAKLTGLTEVAPIA